MNFLQKNLNRRRDQRNRKRVQRTLSMEGLEKRELRAADFAAVGDMSSADWAESDRLATQNLATISQAPTVGLVNLETTNDSGKSPVLNMADAMVDACLRQEARLNNEVFGLSAATPIQVGGTISGSIGLIETADWYSFDAEAGATYEIELNGQLRSKVVSVFDSDFNMLTFANDSNGTGAQVSFQTPAGGIHFIQVSSAAGFMGEYQLSLNSATTSPPAAPTVIHVGETVSGSLRTTGSSNFLDWDRDNYEFQGEQGVTYNLDISHSTMPTMAVFVTDENYREMAVSDGSVSFEAPMDGTYRVMVTNGAFDGGTYDLTLSAETTPPTTTVIHVGETVHGSLLPGSTDPGDWGANIYQFQGSEGDTYNLDISNGTTSVGIVVVDESGNTVTTSNGFDGHASFEAPATGTYVVLVTNGPNPGGAYDLTIGLEHIQLWCGVLSPVLPEIHGAEGATHGSDTD